jgi:hypothetical protein
LIKLGVDVLLVFKNTYLAWYSAFNPPMSEEKERIFWISMHGGLTVHAFPTIVSVKRGRWLYANPVLHGRIRRSKVPDKKSMEIFSSLNWNFISCCPEETVEDFLIISCQGYTFELEMCRVDKEGILFMLRDV